MLVPLGSAKPCRLGEPIAVSLEELVPPTNLTLPLSHVDTLTYDEKRLALRALGVQVRVWTINARDEAGEPLPRWDMQVRLLTPSPSLVPYTTRRRRSRRTASLA